MRDEDPSREPGWAMKEDAKRSWPIGWPKRWMQWAYIAAALAVLGFNAAVYFG